MNRTLLIAMGVLAWSIAAADAALHLMAGDVVVPLGMAAIFVVWTGLRAEQHRRLALRRVPVSR